MIELKGDIEKISSGVSKEGDVIVKVTLTHNLTKSGVLSTVGDLTAIQDQPVSCVIALYQ